MKQKLFPRWGLLMLCCTMVMTSFAQEVNIEIEGYSPVGTYKGYPLYAVHPGNITVSSSKGSFDGIFVDDGRIKYNSSSYWNEYTLDIAPYCDGEVHKLQLKKSSSNYGICYFFTPNGDLINGIYYFIKNEAATVVGVASQDIEVANILDSCKVEGISYPVTSILVSAFKGCSSLVSITLPEGLTSIGNYAFEGCSSLASVTLPEGLTSIGNNAFYDCSSLASIAIPNSVISIGEKAFYDNGLKSITFGTGLQTIGEDAFSRSSGQIAKAFWLGNTPPAGYEEVEALVHYVSNDQYTMSNRQQYQFLSSVFTVDGTVYVPISPSDRTCDVVDCVYSQEHANVTIADKVSNRGVEMSVLNINPYAFYDNDYVQQVRCRMMAR